MFRTCAWRGDFQIQEKNPLAHASGSPHFFRGFVCFVINTLHLGCGQSPRQEYNSGVD
jgi:hypothetical protein